MFSAFRYGYLLSFGLILPLEPQRVSAVIIWLSAIYLVYNLTRIA